MMAGKHRGKLDPIESIIEKALDPGTFITDRASYAFVNDLDSAAMKIAELIQSDPARAVMLYGAFIAGSYEKAEETDDSSGSFGDFVLELVCGWIKARQAAGADPDDTVARLLVKMDDDPYGFIYRADAEAVKVLNKAGLAAFEKQVRARYDAAATTQSTTTGTSGDNPNHAHWRWGDALRSLYLAQKNVEAYIAIANDTGLTAQDCHAIATILGSNRKPGEALAWVERGIDSEKTAKSFASRLDLLRLKRELLKKLGRGDEALAAAWAEYKSHPSEYTYDDMIKLVPKTERPTWHAKAMDAAQGAALQSVIGLLLKTKEIERLAERMRQSTDAALESLSHYTTEPAAKKLEKSHPDAAARLWRAQGLRIINAGKSKYYDAALANFECAMRCFEKAGLATEWQKTVIQVRTDHRRKNGFIARFEKLNSGSGPSATPSFLERAKARWGK